MKKIKSNIISEQVFNQLLKQIVDGIWLPGTKIPSQDNLSKELGVSRVTIRESIQKLVALELLKSVRGEGTYVREPSSESIINPFMTDIVLSKIQGVEVTEYRRIFEPGIMDLVVDRATVDDIAKLEGKLDEMKAMVGNPEEFSRADLEFHVVLSEITRNSFIIKMEKLISGVFASVIESITEKSSEIYEKAISYHMGIVEAIKNRDKKLAKDIMIESIDEHQRQV